MDGLRLLHRARKAGLAVATDGDKLMIRGPRKAEPVALLLLANKPAVMMALTAGAGLLQPRLAISFPSVLPPVTTLAEAPAAWQSWCHSIVRWRTRSGRYHATEAAILAYAEAIDAWSVLHPAPVTPPGACAGCGKMLGVDALDLANGTRVHFQPGRWRCLTAAGLDRKGRAAIALAALGLTAPEGWEP